MRDASGKGGNRWSGYSIGELAHEFNVTMRMLRFYEERGLLTPRREGHRRVYDDRQRARLATILKAKRLGFTLAEIKSVCERVEECTAPPIMLPLTRQEIERQISHLEDRQRAVQEAITELTAQRDAADAPLP